MKIIDKLADANHRLVDTLDNTVVQIDKTVLELKRDMSSRIGAEEDYEASVDAKVKKMTDSQATLTKSVETYSKNFTSFKREQTGRAGGVKKRMDTLQQNYMNPSGRELQMRDMDSKFRHELEKIRNNESDERTKFQVDIERNLETKLEEVVVVFREHKVTNKNQIGNLTNRLDQAFTEENEMKQIGKSQNTEWKSKMSNQLREDTASYKGETELSAYTVSSKQIGLITVVISIVTKVESTPVGLTVVAKDGAGGEQFCLNVATTARTATTDDR